MIELPSLFDHQSDLRDRTRSALAKHGRVILCAQTGVGKTRCAKNILGASANREPRENASGRSLFAVHRRGLVENATDSFNEQPPLPHGVIMSGEETAFGRRIQVASIDTLLSWFVDGEGYVNDLTFDLLVFDEAHSHHAKLARFLKYHDAKREELGLHRAYVIGLTATPEAKGLADVYKEIVKGPSTQWLIDNKYLSPFRYFRATQGNLSALVKRGGDFTQKSVASAMDGLAGDLVRDWKRFAEGRPTVGFFPRRSHAQDAMELLREAGVRVAYVDGNTPDDSRRRIFWELNNGRIDYLCNVQVVERGTDIPAISCVQLCVATASVVRFRQLIGRGSRMHPGKQDCVVIDHGGCVQRCGFFEDDPHWTLDITEKDPGEQGTRPTIECPGCDAIYRGGKCRNCGYEPTPRERRSQGLDFDGSELKEVKPSAKKSTVKSAEELMVSVLYLAGRSGRTWRQACGIFKSKSKKQGTDYKVPRFVKVGGERYECVRYDSADTGRRVSALYPFTVNRGEHGGDYHVQRQETVGVPY